MKFETQNEITAERLKELRKLNNLSQKELAKRTMIKSQ